MVKNIIKIGIINDSYEDFMCLFKILKKVKDDYSNVYFDFSDCEFLRPNAVAFLGGVAKWIESQEGIASFGWDTLHNKWVRMTLQQNGFASNFGNNVARWDGDSIPYREDCEKNSNDIMDYLEKYWIGKGWVHVSSRLMDAIVGNTWEIYNNVFDHSASSIGVFSCGQYFKHYNELTLAVVDFGVGIPSNVKSFLGKDERASRLQSSSCLKWAFQRGNTTKVDEPGGLGLGLLKEFVSLNQGKLEMYSNDGYVLIDKDGESYKNTEVSFEGTLVYITLRCDEALYHFKDEVNV